jgi:hypothetical protein
MSARANMVVNSTIINFETILTVLTIDIVTQYLLRIRDAVL